MCVKVSEAIMGIASCQVFIAASRLHEAGVVHGDLLSSRNIIQMGLAPRIIDFSTATRHHCQNGIPTNPYPMLAQGTRRCQELADMVKTYGLNDMTKLQLALSVDYRYNYSVLEHLKQSGELMAIGQF